MRIMNFKHTGVNEKTGTRGDGKKINIKGGARLETKLYNSSEKSPILEITENTKNGMQSGLFIIFENHDERKRYLADFKKLLK